MKRAGMATLVDVKAVHVKKSTQNLLGLILEREGFLTPNQVKAIIEEQNTLKGSGRVVPFGQIALERQLVTPHQLQRALQLQIKLAVPPGARKPLGLYLIEAGIVAPTQLLQALENQKMDGRRLGEILIENGWILEAMLEHFLMLQRNDTAQEAEA